MRWTHSVSIDAPADVVWALTTDVAGWPRLSSTMQSVQRLDEGPLRVGSSARIKQPGRRVAVWTVTRLEPGSEFSWHTVRRGRTITGTHRVTAEGVGCRNTLEIEMDGPFAPMLGLVMRYALRTENAGFTAEAQRRSART
jgi:hypothetical protein